MRSRNGAFCSALAPIVFFLQMIKICQTETTLGVFCEQKHSSPQLQISFSRRQAHGAGFLLRANNGRTFMKVDDYVDPLEDCLGPCPRRGKTQETCKELTNTFTPVRPTRELSKAFGSLRQISAGRPPRRSAEDARSRKFLGWAA